MTLKPKKNFEDDQLEFDWEDLEEDAHQDPKK